MSGLTEPAAQVIQAKTLQEVPPEAHDKAKEAITDTCAAILAGAGGEAENLRGRRRSGRAVTLTAWVEALTASFQHPTLAEKGRQLIIANTVLRGDLTRITASQRRARGDFI
jgi:hypothetical protein